MRVIFLNIWDSKMKEGIREFISEQAETTDVFCLQEVYESSQMMLDSLLPGWKSVYARKDVDAKDVFSQATYMKAPLRVRSSAILLGDVLGAGFGLYTEIESSRGDLHVCNFHGVAYPKRDEKLDDPARLQQSRTLIDFFTPLRGRKIIGGDFNILPDTESIRMFEGGGYVDLIKKFNIPTTRNRLAWEKYPGHEMLYSDYAFVGPDVEMQSFSVPHNEISDHLPLILDIED